VRDRSYRIVGADDAVAGNKMRFGYRKVAERNKNENDSQNGNQYRTPATRFLPGAMS